MTSLDQEQVIEQTPEGGETAAWLKRRAEPRRIAGNPRLPFRAFVVGVGNQPRELDADAHDPSASWTLITLTSPSFRARMPGSMTLRSPTITTVKRDGWM